jgi:FtsH-binding integral membrane protein
MDILIRHPWLIWAIHLVGLACWIICHSRYKFGLTFVEFLIIWAIAGPILSRFSQDSLGYTIAYLLYIIVIFGIPVGLIIKNETKKNPNKSVHPTR